MCPECSLHVGYTILLLQSLLHVCMATMASVPDPWSWAMVRHQCGASPATSAQSLVGTQLLACKPNRDIFTLGNARTHTTAD